MTTFNVRIPGLKMTVVQADGLPVRPDGQIDVEAGLAWVERNLDPSRRNKGGPTTTASSAPSVAEVRRIRSKDGALES